MINFINSLYSFQLWPLPSLAPEKLFLLLCPLLQLSLYALALKHHLLCHCLPKVSTYSRCFLHKPTVLCTVCTVLLFTVALFFLFCAFFYCLIFLSVIFQCYFSCYQQFTQFLTFFLSALLPRLFLGSRKCLVPIGR